MVFHKENIPPTKQSTGLFSQSIYLSIIYCVKEFIESKLEYVLFLPNVC